uniref:uncharacterized protein DDB_G0287625 isoform X2 n=1 Tax=Scatophagus argus TaxID=75038 RepID=UPI001ED7EDBB|nr:uncharacterized protein DDB_G0287625 isoform X2 [Scatophagus argus]
MYRPDKLPHGTTSFGQPQPQDPPLRFGGPCVGPPPGHLPPGPNGPFSASVLNNIFLQNRPPRGHFNRPHCSGFSIDRSAVIALGGRHYIGSPAEPHRQWNPIPVEQHLPDNSAQAGEEFLRCIAANKPLPDYLKGNMAYNLADAFKSANILKEAVKSDIEFQKHVIRSKSCSRSRGTIRSKSRDKSRARTRSRGRSKSHARGKSQVRSKSHSQSWSRSQSRHKRRRTLRSKSQVRMSKSQSISDEKSHGKDKKRNGSTSRSCSNNVGNNTNLTENSLLEGLKLVMNSKELEERLPTLKEAIFNIQASDVTEKVEHVPNEHKHQHRDSQENSTSLENDSMLLPHDRVGSDFSWLQVRSQDDSMVLKADEFEDEESFLYGNGDIEGKQGTTKEKQAKRDGSGTSQTSSHEHKMCNDEERKRDKQARTSKMESLIKELEGLMKEDGLCFLTPVIGFYCQKCQEFIGDLNSAENHAVIHYNCNSSSKARMDQYAGGSKTHLRHCSSSNNQHPSTSGRRDHRDYGYHRSSGDHRIHRDYQDWRDKRDDRSNHYNDRRSHRARQENISLKEEMREERMLITVSCGLTPPPDLRVTEEVKKQLHAIGSHSKVRVEDTDSREKHKVKVESSDGSDSDKVRTQRAKSPKKKKKKKDKKKKDKKDKS